MKNCRLSKRLHQVTRSVTPFQKPESRINTGFLGTSYTSYTSYTQKLTIYIQKYKNIKFIKKIFSLIGSYKKWCNGVTAA